MELRFSCLADDDDDDDDDDDLGVSQSHNARMTNMNYVA